MTIDERSRHALYVRLEELLGPEHATVLMAHLPPVGWADVATKHDLAQFEERMGLRSEALEHKLTAVIESKVAGIHDRMNLQTRAMVFSIVGSYVGMAGFVLAVLRFAS